MLKIVTDSTCDLPQTFIDRYGITVVPLYISIGYQGYRDGVDLTREAFYRNLPAYRPFPTTATPGIDVFKQVYGQLATEGATQILSVHISVSLSATVDNARLAAQDAAVPVTVIDSQQLSMGTGFLVLSAARAAAEGRSVAEIVAMLEAEIRHTYVFAAIDTLEYLRRSGRMNGAIAGIGTILKIKPILKMNNGHPTAERVRTANRAFARLEALIKEVSPLSRAALVHTHNPDRAEMFRQQIAHLLPDTEILSVDITPVLGAHLGPGAVGLACVTQF